MALKKFKPRSPEIYLNKIVGDNTFARLGHLNGLVDDINKSELYSTYKTGIYDIYPFPVTPSMIKGSTKVIDTPATPTMFPYNLESYKVGGVYELGSANDTFIIEYIGTVETTDGSSLYIYPFKTTGTVTCSPSWPGPSPVISSFANGASVADDDDNLVPAELMNIAIDQYAPDAADLYLIAASNTAVDIIYGDAAFEFEFLVVEGTPLKFTLY